MKRDLLQILVDVSFIIDDMTISGRCCVGRCGSCDAEYFNIEGIGHLHWLCGEIERILKDYDV